MPPTMTFNSYTLSTGDDSDPESKIIAVARDDDDGCVARIFNSLVPGRTPGAYVPMGGAT